MKAPLILRVSKGGLPVEWLSWEDTALLYAKGLVVWTFGENLMRVHGGISRATGVRSFLDLHPIVASGADHNTVRLNAVPPLTNGALFRRDRHMCLYCLKTGADRDLTRDHIVPVSRGGRDEWANVATACRSCNHRKSDRRLEEIGLKLNAVPYVPNYAEWMILKNRNILADQMAFLKQQVPKQRRILF